MSRNDGLRTPDRGRGYGRWAGLRGVVVWGRMAVLAGGAVLAGASSAWANDSSVSMAAGGLVLEKTDAVRMEDEDLRISTDEIEVTYRFRNITSAPVTLTVGFPLPSIGHYDRSPTELAGRGGDPVNFVDFKAWVNGDPVTTRAILTATGSDGRDVTSDLESLGLLTVPFAKDVWQKISGDQASLAVRQHLTALGLLVRGWPDWTLHTTFVWEQTFPPGEAVTVRHTYKPVVGGYFAEITDTEWRDRFRADYCTGDSEWAGIRRRATRKTSGPLAILLVDYVLKTGANWAGPIDHFRLTLDKADPDTILTLCWDGGLAKTGPTTFAFEAEAYVPDRDLAIAIVYPTTMDEQPGDEQPGDE